MAGSVNKVIIIGNVGKDPEIRSTNTGSEIASLTIATSDNWKEKSTGERKEKTEWHKVLVFSSGLVGVIKQYVKKGSKVYIEGALQTRKWQDQSGADRYTTEVVLQAYGGTLTLLDSRGSSDNASSAPQEQPQADYGANDELDSEIPF